MSGSPARAMAGEARALEILDGALRVDGADEVQAAWVSSAGGLTRFADSIIHQHTERADSQVHVRVVDGKRSATVTTNRLDAELIREAGLRALEIARLSPPDDIFPGLPGDFGAPLTNADHFDEPTGAATPSWRASRIAEAVKVAGDRPAAGFFSTDAMELAIANTSGVRRYWRGTTAEMTCMIRSGDGTAHDQAVSRRAGEIDAAGLAAELAEWADRSRGPDHVEPGRYPVVLMPLAVAEMIEYLSYMGFSGKDVITGESFFVERAGQRVASDLATITDDAGASIGIPFDWEGVWRQRVPIIERGVARQPVWDTRTAAEAGARTTGHASGSQELGPFAANLVVGAGDRPVDDLVGAIERGLLVRRFWYVNVVNQRETVLTGMTRDGLFLIEDGRVARPVHNLRFTQNVLEALDGCAGAGAEVRPVLTGWGAGVSVATPALQLASFNFTSATTH